jgi:MFS family permease
MKPVTTPLIRRFGFRGVLLWNGLLTAVSILVGSALMPQTPFPVIVAVLFLGGASRSLEFTAFSSISFADVPPAQMNGANTLSSAMMQLSSSVSVALGALVLRASTFVHGHLGAAPNVDDFHLAFVLVAAIAVLAVIDVIKLPSDAAQAVSRPVAPA